jgi:hypothetical protein
MTLLVSKAVPLKLSNGSWSSIKGAHDHVNKCIKRLQNGKSLSETMIDRFWALHAALMDRKHRRIAALLDDTYRDMEYDTNNVILEKLYDLYAELNLANIHRKEKLALRRAGIAKAQ